MVGKNVPALMGCVWWRDGVKRTVGTLPDKGVPWRKQNTVMCFHVAVVGTG